jgi:anaerobic dimethyl sulfoxide reductase subunit B (iron-sulfur subunit)
MNDEQQELDSPGGTLMTRKGILVDYQYCTGCHTCEVACEIEHDRRPSQWGVKVLQQGPWPIEGADGNETGQYVYDFIPAFTRICNLCAERVAKGNDPSCVHHCQANVMKYGSVDELVDDLDGKPWQFLWVPPCA